MQQQQQAESLREQILRYWRANVHAAETAAGVNRVWLKRPNTPQMVAEIELALDELVRAGELERHRMPGKHAVYRRAQGKSQDWAD